MKTTYHSALKNADIQTNASQVKSASKVYDAFGNLRTGSGSWKGQFHYGGQFGYQQDPDSGLKILGHRYYDSSTGRFLTRDPIKDGRNWYSYCANNPTHRIDDTGEIWETLLDIAGIGMDIYDIAQDPSNGWAWGSLGWSVVAVAVPFVPGSWAARVAQSGGKILSKSDIALGGAKSTYNIRPGKRGGPLHQKMVAKVEEDFSNAGFKHIGGGSKPESKRGNRFPDLIFLNGDREFFVQVGKKTHSGMPVSREIDAGGELSEIGDVLFVPYN